MPRVYQAVVQKFAFYFGEHHPTLSLTSPHKEEQSSINAAMSSKVGHLNLHLISYQDGRESVVDLTKTLAQMSQKGKLSPRDISMELVDAERLRFTHNSVNNHFRHGERKYTALPHSVCLYRICCAALRPRVSR